ncbi:L-2-hydroxyglutarate oxidase [Paraburkholderia lycopersici]|uniref:L-2-hydroxyglutarate oxidase n=1 Tax=Paraburkholderia lycopersici TaxID=416944 RepID=A0A1G6QV60_9BURK|nr:L-2-hydroxyglutarate oxidase [Paraburkholderia lycopersici]SDC95794.1 L-2-hydroxyglutarate oxidase [Paraburkholderia lycopersici]
MSETYDFAIVGGGIVGLATGVALAGRFPDASILLLEKEAAWARHQTGHNSGVIHSGIYYRPGSLKAKFAREGRRALIDYCERRGIAYELCGKVIVATQPEEVPLMEALAARGRENGLGVEAIGPQALREIEPHVLGLRALRVPDAGIVDYARVCESFAGQLAEHGVTLRLETRVTGIRSERDGVVVETPCGAHFARYLVNCAGLHSDRVARLAGVDPEVRIVPFRGEYYMLRPERQHLVRHLVYPVPDPAFPFLGVHYTRMIGGGVEAGPNAVLAFAREGYTKRDVSMRDLSEVIAFPGFWRLCAKHWREGAQEMHRSFSKRAFVRSLQRLIPEIGGDDLEPAAAGVRAQALQSDGGLVDDFRLVQTPRALHVCNAPSPAATASIAIGRHIAQCVPAV